MKPNQVKPNDPNYGKYVELMREYIINHCVSPTASQLKEFFGVTLRRLGAGNGYEAYRNGIHFADVNRNEERGGWDGYWCNGFGGSFGANTFSECRFVLALNARACGNRSNL